MVISRTHLTGCGFAKVIAWQLEKSTQSRATRPDGESMLKFRSRISKLPYDKFVQTFTECKENFSVDFWAFQSKLPDLQIKFV